MARKAAYNEVHRITRVTKKAALVFINQLLREEADQGDPGEGQGLKMVKS